MHRFRVRITAVVSLVVLFSIGGTTLGVRREGAHATVLPISPGTSGEHRQLVMLFNFQDQPANRPWSRDAVNSVVFGQSKQYWEAVSYNQISLTVDLVGWYTAAINSSDCSGNFRDAAENGARALGFEPNNYAHRIYIYPYRPCGAQGGITLLSTDSAGNMQSWVYLNGVADFYSVAHEIGHTFGFRHSNSLNCAGVSFGSNCANAEYGDYYDVMGYRNTGVANSYHRDLAGWLGARIQTVTSDGTFVLTPTGAVDDNLKAIRIPQSYDALTNSTTYYYLEFRQPVGYDAFLSNYPQVTNGLLIRIGTIGTDVNKLGFGSQLLDMTPGTSGRNEALPIGASYVDPAIPLTITLLDANPLGATVSVGFGALPTPTPTPTPQPTPTPTPTSSTITVSTNQASYSLSQTVSTRATVLNAGTPVVGASVSFTLTKPNGGTVTINGITATDGTATAKYRLNKKDPTGTYLDSAATVINGRSLSKATSFTVGY